MNQIVVTCDKCHRIMALSDKMELEEAESLKSRITMNPFGAPRCQNCTGIEPFSDINLAHTIEVMEFDATRKIGDQIQTPNHIDK